MTSDKSAFSDDNFSIEDIIDMKVFHRFFEKFNNTTGFTAVLLKHPGEKVLISTGSLDLCTKYHYADPESKKICRRDASCKNPVGSLSLCFNKCGFFKTSVIVS